MPFQ
jgi:transposase